MDALFCERWGKEEVSLSLISVLGSVFTLKENDYHKPITSLPTLLILVCQKGLLWAQQVDKGQRVQRYCFFISISLAEH